MESERRVARRLLASADAVEKVLPVRAGGIRLSAFEFLTLAFFRHQCVTVHTDDQSVPRTMAPSAPRMTGAVWQSLLSVQTMFTVSRSG